MVLKNLTVKPSIRWAEFGFISAIQFGLLSMSCLLKIPRKFLPFFSYFCSFNYNFRIFFCWDNKLDNVTVASFSRFQSDEILGNLTVVYYGIILKNRSLVPVSFHQKYVLFQFQFETFHRH